MARKPKPVGPAGLLNPDTHEVIIQAIRFGFTWKDAATRAGISERIIHAWRERGAAALDDVYDQLADQGSLPGTDDLSFDAVANMIPQKERRYAALVSDLAKANLDAKMNALAHIHKHMPADWRAASWFLERRFPDEFGPGAVKVQADVRSVNVDVDPSDEETLSAIIAAMAEVRIGGTDQEEKL